ncbi:MAG: hypothetical protein E7644_02625 [Ruminococcaceae bacterium]|nr:hypothetical protein [Oscillospiraceae bacterium]
MGKVGFFDRVTLAVLALMVTSGGIALAFFPAERMSVTENRLLAEEPAFSMEALADGSYAAGWDAYATERFPGRSALRAVRATVELAAGKGEVNGVILGRDGSLLRRHTANAAAWEKNRRALARVEQQAAAAKCPLTVAIAPRRIDACAAQLPVCYRNDREAALYAKVREALPTALLLSGFEEGEWFRTDHHWQASGAYRAYVALGDALGYEPYPLAAFTPQTVSESFLGTADAAAGIPGIVPDAITLLRYEGDEAFSVKTEGKPAPFAGFYDMEKLKTRDGYGVFLGGNYGMLTVDPEEGDQRPTLLLVKDSFANALIPFLARHYRIVAVDPRYGRPDMNTLLAGADKALVLCGLETLAESPFLAPLLR